MSSSSYHAWQNLPDVIFGDITMIVGLESLGDLLKCRQVCQSWNIMISEVTKHKKDTVQRKAENLADQFRDGRRRRRRSRESNDQNTRMVRFYDPLLPEIVSAAGLAQHGLLGSLKQLRLVNVDLASVPSESLASLTSCAVSRLIISSISNCDLSLILDNSKGYVSLTNQNLSNQETQALVRAMESNIETVVLGFEDEVSLDITALTQYSGRGTCVRMGYYWSEDKDRYRDEIRRWAQRNNWKVIMLSGGLRCWRGN